MPERVFLEKRQAKFERQVAQAVRSIAGWRQEFGSLDRVASSLKGMGATKAPRGRRKVKHARRGTWKPGRPGRPPKWYSDQQEAKSGRKSSKETDPKKDGRK